MTSSESSSEPIEREEKPFVSFVVLVSVIIGAFYFMRKYVGSIPALIVAYLLYVYRNELRKEFGDMFHGRH